MSVGVYNKQTDTVIPVAPPGATVVDPQPVENSTNPITSGYMYDYKKSVDSKLSTSEVIQVPLSTFNGNLTEISTAVEDGPNATISYCVKNGICYINFSFIIAAKAISLTTSDVTDTTIAHWLTSSMKLPKPMIRARGQSTPVNANVYGVLNLRVDEDGTLLILVNNHASEVGQYYQNALSYPILDN